jgi:hypothetical protein
MAHTESLILSLYGHIQPYSPRCRLNPLFCRQVEERIVSFQQFLRAIGYRQPARSFGRMSGLRTLCTR